jgi:hypothetical protein
MPPRSRTARLLPAAALVLAGPALAACSTAAPTDAVYTQAAGVNNRDSRVDVLNAVIVSTTNGSGTFVATLVNNERPQLEGGQRGDTTDRLTGIAGVGDAAGIETQVRPVDIEGGGLVALADGNGVPVSGAVIRQGHFVELELTFANADPVTLEVPVVANRGVFEGQDGPAPTEEPSEDHAETETESH